ncbi:carbonic anhydrase [Imleria badia]|nr:carbonic anhydrase [Imleria badia]
MIPPTSPVHALLAGNAKWADAVNRTEPGFFQRSAEGQYPKALACNDTRQVLWIGCADSRVPESLITGARPGDIFVHRNIANQFHPDDDSALAVLSYAIGVVGVQHVVIAGHTQCGGAAACYQAVSAPTPEDTPSPSTPLSRWLTPLTHLIADLDLDLATTPASSALDIIIRENVKRQVQHVCAAEPVRQAWAAGKQVWVHGWVYDVASGRIQDLEVSRGPLGVHAQL